jgi:hypothetical protein
MKNMLSATFAALPLFAIHQFIEGFVWVGLDGILCKDVTRGYSNQTQGPGRG